MGLVNLFSAVTPALQERLLLIESLFPLQVRAGTRLATALAGFALIVLASGIWRGKKAAWWVTVAVLLASTAGHLIKGFDFEEASLAAVLLLGMLIFRQRFQAGSDAPTVSRGLRTLLIAFAFTLVYGMAGFYLLDRHFAVRYNLWQAAYQTLRMLTSFTGPAMPAATLFGRYFVDFIYLVGIGTTGYALLALLAPVLQRQKPGISEKQRAAAIVDKSGRTILARFCLLPDKQYFFSPGGSLITYAYANRTAVVLGDPVGPEEDGLAAVQAFQEYCFHNDWLLTFYQTRSETLPIYHTAGMQSLKIGEEALVDCTAFSLKGSEMKPVRNAASKMERMGFICQVYHPPHPPALIDPMKQISDGWVQAHGGKEMKFSLGWFDPAYLNATDVVTVQDAGGKVIAFANLVEADQKRELGVDLMRHAEEMPAGAMDFLFSGLILEAQKQGYLRFNLGLSGLAGVGEHHQDPVIERALHYIYTHVHTAYNFKGLHSFKQKFSPDWSPRYLIYPNLASLPVIAAAINEVSW